MLCTAALIGWCARLDFARQGDGWEYLVLLDAFDRHGSADVRPGDLDAMFAHIDSWELIDAPTRQRRLASRARRVCR